MLRSLHILGFTICVALAGVSIADSAETPAPVTKAPVEQVYTLPGGAGFVPQIGPSSGAFSVTYSPNGKYLLSGYNGDVKLWDIASGALIHVYHIGFQVSSVAFSPDGSRIVECGETGGEEPYGQIAILDVVTGETATKFRDDDGTSPLASVAFSPDGKSVVTSGFDHSLTLFDSQTADVRWKAEARDDSEVAFSPDGRMIAAGSAGKTLKVWGAADGKLLKTFTDTSEVETVAFSPDGNRLATQSRDRHITLWDVITGTQIRNFAQPPPNTDLGVYISDFSAAQIAFSPDGRSVFADGQLWDAATGEKIRTFDGHATGQIRAVAFAPDGQSVATGSDADDSINLWNATTGQQIRVFKYGRSVSAVAFAGDGQSFVTATDDRMLRRWDLKQGTLLDAHSVAADITSLAKLSPDGSLFVNYKDKNELQFWDVSTGKLVSTFKDFSADAAGFSFAANGQTIAIIGDHKVVAFDVKSGDQRKILASDDQEYRQVAFAPNGRFVVIGLGDGKFVISDTNTGKIIRKLSALGKGEIEDDIASFVSPDSRTILLANGRNINLYDASTGKLVKKLQQTGWLESAFTFSPDGRWLVSSGERLEVRDVASGKIVRRFFDYAPHFNTIAISHDNRLGLSGSEDGTAKLWDFASGKLLATVYASGADWAVMAPDGRYVGSGDVGKFVRIIRGLDVLSMDDFVKLNRRETLADVLAPPH